METSFAVTKPSAPCPDAMHCQLGDVALYPFLTQLNTLPQVEGPYWDMSG